MSEQEVGMTVAELIEYLQKLPLDARVYAYDDTLGDYPVKDAYLWRDGIVLITPHENEPSRPVEVTREKGRADSQ